MTDLNHGDTEIRRPATRRSSNAGAACQFAWLRMQRSRHAMPPRRCLTCVEWEHQTEEPCSLLDLPFSREEIGNGVPPFCLHPRQSRNAGAGLGCKGCKQCVERVCTNPVPAVLDLRVSGLRISVSPWFITSALSRGRFSMNLPMNGYQR